MATIVLSRHDVALHVRGGALEVRVDGRPVDVLQPHEVDEVQVHGGADVSPSARNLLLRSGIDTVFLTADGRYRGRLVPAEGRAGALRLAQYALVSDPARRTAVARAIVAGKIANQLGVLTSRHRSDDDVTRAARLGLREILACLPEATSPEVLRGFEGLAARTYFSAWPSLLRSSLFGFPGRRRRPPTDPVNAALSYGYTLLHVRVESAVRRVGLDPHLGFLHEPSRGGAALAFDLVEELRPLVDRLVLTAFNRRELGPEDFRTPLPEEVGDDPDRAADAIFLERAGRDLLLRRFDGRLQDTLGHPVTGKAWTIRHLLVEQAHQVARIAKGEQEAYLPLDTGR